jgi:hypothetical protein
MKNKIINWANKRPINTGILGMTIMLILELIFILPVMIKVYYKYGWYNPMPNNYIIYFASVILISFWLTFEIINYFLYNNKTTK